MALNGEARLILADNQIKKGSIDALRDALVNSNVRAKDIKGFTSRSVTKKQGK